MALDSKAGGLADPDFTDRLKEIPQDIAALIKQEIELARAEFSQKAEQVRSELEQARREADEEIRLAKSEAQKLGKKAGMGAGLFGGAGLLALGAFATFTVFLVGAAALAMPVWAAALVVTVLYAVVAGVLSLAGKNKLKQVQQRIPQATGHVDRLKGAAASAVQRIRAEVPLAPERTISSLKESKEHLAEAWRRGSNGDGPAVKDGYVAAPPAAGEEAAEPERIAWNPRRSR